MCNTLKSFAEHASRCDTRGNDFVCRETDLRNCRTFTVNMAPLCYKLGKSYVAKESAWLVCTAISSLVLKCRLVMRSKGKDGERKRKFRQARSCTMGRVRSGFLIWQGARASRLKVSRERASFISVTPLCDFLQRSPWSRLCAGQCPLRNVLHVQLIEVGRRGQDGPDSATKLTWAQGVTQREFQHGQVLRTM